MVQNTSSNLKDGPGDYKERVRVKPIQEFLLDKNLYRILQPISNV